MTSTGLRSRFGPGGRERGRDVTILRNNGSGNFAEPATSPEAAGGNPTALAAADLDGDLDPDLSVTDAALDRVTVLRNR